jgi:hypothetical protein
MSRQPSLFRPSALGAWVHLNAPQPGPTQKGLLVLVLVEEANPRRTERRGVETRPGGRGGSPQPFLGF